MSALAKVTITTALSLIGVRLLRGSRAAVRHALLAGAFGVLLVLPIASVVAPPVRIAVPIAAQARRRTACFHGSHRRGIAHRAREFRRWCYAALRGERTFRCLLYC